MKVNKLIVIISVVSIIFTATLTCSAQTILINENTETEVPEEKWFIVSKTYTSPDIDGNVRTYAEEYIFGENYSVVAYSKDYSDYWGLSTLPNIGTFFIDDYNEDKLFYMVEESLSASGNGDEYDFDRMKIEQIGNEKYIVIPMKAAVAGYDSPVYGMCYVISDGENGYCFASYSPDGKEKAKKNIESILNKTTYRILIQREKDSKKKGNDASHLEGDISQELLNMLWPCLVFIFIICYTIKNRKKRGGILDMKSEGKKANEIIQRENEYKNTLGKRLTKDYSFETNRTIEEIRDIINSFAQKNNACLTDTVSKNVCDISLNMKDADTGMLRNRQRWMLDVIVNDLGDTRKGVITVVYNSFSKCMFNTSMGVDCLNKKRGTDMKDILKRRLEK